MSKLQLIHNEAAGPLPAGLARVHHGNIVHVDHLLDIETCGRWGGDVDQHVWILRDRDDPEQDGVIDCERRTA